jgi:hypothetical protein
MKAHICIIACILLLALTMGAGCLEAVLGPGVSAEYPHIIPADQAASMPPSSISYPFMKYTVTFSIPIDPAIYEGARNADKNAHLYEDLEDEEWLSGYYRAFVFDDNLDDFFADIGNAFASTRSDHSFDDDEYLELMAVFVQSLPYESSDMLVEPKFPIETVAEGRGDCDDKSILLAGLLAREGYDVALLFFEQEKHMAVGVKADRCSYKTTGYAFIETTNVSFVGIVPSELEGGLELTSEPLVIRVGEGTKGYGKCDQTMSIDAALHDACDAIDTMKPEIERSNQDLEASYEALEQMRTRMDSLAASGRIGEYNRLVPEFNRQVQEYNAQLEEFGERQDEYNHYVGVYNYILTHQHDREGTYAWVNGQARVWE